MAYKIACAYCPGNYNELAGQYGAGNQGKRTFVLDWRAWLLPPTRPAAQDEEDYFLPDLCQGEGLLAVIVITLLLSFLIAVVSSGLYDFSWLLLGQVALLALWIALASAFFLCLIRRYLSSLQPVRSGLLSYLLILTVAIVSAFAAEQALAFGLLGRGFSWLGVAQTVLVAAIPAGILLRYLFMQQQLRVQQRAELEARIQALQARIRPHFLFNSMNMIASLIGSDPEKAERVVEDLSTLFRRALTGSQTLVPLREELALCRSYLALEKMRLGDRLDVEWQISDYGAGVQIPCLSLQPVLENAVYHGIQLIQDGGKIEIKVKRLKDRISIVVRNPLNPRIQHNKGSKMAINNVQHRLKAHFGPSAEVRSEVMDNSYTTHINYPLNW